MTPKFQIGDQVWRPTFESSVEWVTCPDCGGTGRLRVTFHDETTVSIDCQNCSVGYDPPTGKVKVYVRRPEAHQGVISGIEVEPDKVTYRLGRGLHSSWLVEEDALSIDHDGAFEKAVALAREADETERRRILEKEKPARTWAWNARYHRRCIKDAQRNLDYHTRKLAAANLKVRADKAAKAEPPL